jgi:hypothetical protein
MLGSALVSYFPRESLLTVATRDPIFAVEINAAANVEMWPRTGRLVLSGTPVVNAELYTVGNVGLPTVGNVGLYTVGNVSLYSGTAVPAIGLPTMIPDYASGVSNDVVITVGQLSDAQPSLGPNTWTALLDTWIALGKHAATVYVVSRPRDRLLEAETEFFVAAWRMPPNIRDALTHNFSQLMAALREEDGPVQLELESLRFALRFVSSACQRMAPYFSLNELGNFYLQWFDGRESVVGVTFRADGLAIWSSSQPDPTTPTIQSLEAGERSAELLGQILPGIAPWAFRNAIARRAAA